ncbi:G-type lectin S-receptor-like serine/threonine-protein kinase B120 [Pyrus x bretschneideri]|uniref:G-type lectin S-receptor-like serine/threonine-protein kinase B120 n=1 Tax=Pyrus x bretschneideri TaxID=225117 RepID=UPI000511A66C|nr:G-type lectin S-receptor-like serine/threonine-protein kinase B120 [Pyrus x bretschneideri]
MGWLLLCVFMFLLSVCTSLDNLVPEKSLDGDQTLISSSGTFALGFFSTEKSKKFFLGIWYNKIPKNPKVWVANRGSPLDSPGVLMLSADGNLVMLDGMTRKQVVWSSNASIPASEMNSTTAVLMDSGNLQLIFEQDILWQSFDHPSDTLLPSMKLSLNKITGQQSRLTSWAALDDPQPGMFSAGIDLKVPLQLIIWKGNATYWRSAVHFGEVKRYFRNQSGGFVSYNFDANEIDLTFGVSDSSVKPRVVLSPTGELNLQLWTESDTIKRWFKAWEEPIYKCDFYAACGPYGACDKNSDPLSSQCKCLKGFRTELHKQSAQGDWPGGCVREKALTCDKGEGFEKFEKMKLPDHAIILGNMSTSECESECLRNCSCTAYAYSNVIEGGTVKCLTWLDDLTDLVENHWLGQTIYIRVHRSDQVAGGKGHVDKLSLVIPIVSTTAGLLTIIFGYLLWKKTLRNEGSVGGTISEAIRNVSFRGGKNDTELPVFSLRSILASTNNFSEANKLGEGGFGPVYKGILIANEEVAIKRLSKKSGQGHEEFMNELKLIAKLQHTNLVRLLGCCIEDKEMILIYEYMPNRSLDRFLFDSSEKTKLDWGTRFRIIEGVAQGVLYIHKYSRLKIIHRDLKASNVLLDGTMKPKISDFGMAKIFEMDQTEANTNRVVGTYGYMSPEYALYGHFSEKLDVFSFGVLLLEIVSGKRNSACHRFEDPLTLAGWAWKLWKKGRGIEVIDESLREMCQLDEALRCIHVGFLCVQEAPADRPSMSSVIRMLQSNEATSLPPSKEPAFSIHRRAGAVGSSPQASARFSNNELTISLPEGR